MSMKPVIAGFLILASASSVLAQTPLRVVRSSPAGEGGAGASISVTFDRPVAGSLDRSIDPAMVMRINPAIDGRYEWRDPVTLRFIPRASFPQFGRVTVTVGTDFVAMDGSRLSQPHQFVFRVRGATLLASRPASEWAQATNLPPDQRFEVLYSEPVDTAIFNASAAIEMAATCRPRNIGLRVTGQRKVEQDDGYAFTEAGGWDRNRSLDTLRRVVVLAPRSPLPHGCTGVVILPKEAAPESPDGTVRYTFSTYGDLRLSAASCGYRSQCPTGPVRVEFTTPVKGADVLRHVKLVPAVNYSLYDTNAVSTLWTLDGTLKPRTRYAIVADTAIRDVFGQRLTGNPAVALQTTGFSPQVSYPIGRQLVERVGFRTLPVEHVNADTLIVEMAPVPDSLERSLLSRYAWGLGEFWEALAPRAERQRIPVGAGVDRSSVTGIRLPVPDATRVGAPTLYALKVRSSAGEGSGTDAPITVVQVTDLGVTARVGIDEGTVWVTGVSDGLPRANAEVTLYSSEGAVLASSRTDSQGLARLSDFPAPVLSDSAANEVDEWDNSNVEGYVAVKLGNDRAVVPVNRYDPDLSPWVFGVASAYGGARIPVAAAVFTERGIYRPGEEVYAKAILRQGALGSLRVPSRGDSLRWAFMDRDGQPIKTRTVALSQFGTADERVDLPASALIGDYRVAVAVRRQGRWQSVASTSFRVAEYRPPEFLVDVIPQGESVEGGARYDVLVRGRYLFGAPMARAAVSWEARSEVVSPWELSIPGLDDWTVGARAWDWGEEASSGPRTQFFERGVDSLDAAGEKNLRLAVPEITDGVPRRIVVNTAVTDVNRQSVGSMASTIVHPADFYVAVKSRSVSWFWRAGSEEKIEVRTVAPDGKAVAGVNVRGTLVRREWHQVRRERDGAARLVGEWVADTVASCDVTVRSEGGVDCTLTPTDGGIHTLIFEGTDRRGRKVSTTMSRWVSGPGFVPWSDETQFKMDIIADRERYAPGDTATILLASPFTDAEAWLTIERERVIESRRIRLTSGATTVKIPITEAHAPNAYVSVVVVRGRSAPPGRVDDPGRPTLRVGYTELRVTPEVKRLAVNVRPLADEYRPGDTARVAVEVRDRAGNGSRSEVTLWAVDEGVLSLTGYKTPDPIDLLYARRSLGLRLASNLVAVAPQVPEGEKGQRAPGGGGGSGDADILRSRFKTTAFFLGSVLTDSLGNGVATARLPDNLTTFRVMAVAVTAGDRYGSGESPMLVTRPLVARAALPRFVRAGDEFSAGTAVNRRDGAAVRTEVRASVTGIRLTGSSRETVTLAAGKGSDVRFNFRAQAGDSAVFTFNATSGRDADGVRVSVPVKPTFHPRAHTVTGVLHDTATVEFLLPAELDPSKSTLSLNVGGTPTVVLRGAYASMRLYPYDCSEQIIAAASPLMAMLRVPGMLTGNARAAALADLGRGVQALVRRQRSDGGIGYWSSSDWTTPWLSAYVGKVLLDARELGVEVDSLAVGRLEDYLRSTLRGERGIGVSPVASWYSLRSTQLGDQVAALDFLSQLKKADESMENELLRMAPQLKREDRVRLAGVLLRRGAEREARGLMEPVWNEMRIEGRRAVLTENGTPHYFRSDMRELSRILMVTMDIQPSHRLVGPLLESVAMQGQHATAQRWNTQDVAFAAEALAKFEEHQRANPAGAVSVRSGRREIARDSAGGNRVISLNGLVSAASGDTRTLRLSLEQNGNGYAFYYLTVNEVPSVPPVRPSDSGIQVERWYERHSDGQPITSAAEGELVRVMIRVTVPSTREFVVLDDPLPAGLEAIDLSLLTSTAMSGPVKDPNVDEVDDEAQPQWGHGRWDGGWWSPWEHREIRDDRVVYSAVRLWPGSYTATYLTRATTVGTFVRPPAHAEEMYNPGVNGRSDGGVFTVTARTPD